MASFRDDVTAAVAAGWDSVSSNAAAIYDFVANDPLISNAAEWYAENGDRLLNGLLGLGRDDGPPYEPDYTQNGGQGDGVCYEVYGVADVYRYGTLNRSYAWNGGQRTGPLPEFRLVVTSNNVEVHDDTGIVANLGTRPSGTVTAEWRGGYVDISRCDQQPQDDNDIPPLIPTPATPPTPIPMAVSPGGRDAQLTFGSPYIDGNGDIRTSFTMVGDGWEIQGSLNGNTGETNYGPQIDTDSDGIPDSDPQFPPGAPGDEEGDSDDECVKNIICGENEWPIQAPAILTDPDAGTEEIATLAQAVAWLIKNIDATSGQWPLDITIRDTDPLTEGDQEQTVSFPNQAELLAEQFGLMYESNLNTQLLLAMLMKQVPEVLATKNAAIVSQDFLTTITEYIGMRTEDKEIRVPCNFSPERADSIIKLMEPTEQVLQGIKDVDPHTLVEWLQKIHYQAQISAITSFRPAGLLDVLSQEIESFTKEPQEKSAEDWETFLEYLNSQFSAINRGDINPRPKVYSVDNVTDPSVVVPDVSG